MRAGVLGGIVSFIGFTLPSVILLITFALLLQNIGFADANWIQGLKVVAVVVVAQAILGMAQKLTPDVKRKTIALFALVTTLLWQTAYTQVGVIIMAGFIGFLLFKGNIVHEKQDEVHFPISRRFGILSFSVFIGFLFILPFLREITSSDWIAMFDSFFRSGSLVFGGGHVVLPLLEREFVPAGWLTSEQFLAGYGATQAVPGPLFTFGAYIGAIIKGWKGGLFATFAIFLPSFLLIIGALPFWQAIRQNRNMKAAFLGVNAAVVGILIAALYHPIWTNSIFSAIDFAFAAILYAMLAVWKLPPWVIVLTGAIGGLLIY